MRAKDMRFLALLVMSIVRNEWGQPLSIEHGGAPYLSMDLCGTRPTITERAWHTFTGPAPGAIVDAQVKYKAWPHVVRFEVYPAGSDHDRFRLLNRVGMRDRRRRIPANGDAGSERAARGHTSA